MAQNRKGSGPLVNVTKRVIHVRVRYFLFSMSFVIYELAEMQISNRKDMNYEKEWKKNIA